MLRSLKEHIYGGKNFRPTPILLDSPSHFSVLTVWGQQVEGIEDELRDLAPREEESLSDHALRLHQHLLDTYHGKLGLEALIMRRDQTHLVQWCACGQPGLFLSKNKTSVLLHQALDLNFDSSTTPFGVPLPSTLLGVGEEAPSLSTGRFQLHPGQKIVLLSRSWVPSEALTSIFDADQCISALAQEAENMPFWWGLFEPDL